MSTAGGCGLLHSLESVLLAGGGRKPNALVFTWSRNANPSQGLPGGLGGQRGEGLGSSKAPLPYSCSRQRTTCSPAFPPTPGLPAVALVTGAALWLPELPPPTMARQSCPKHIIGSRLQRRSWNQAEPPVSAKTLPFVPGPDKPDRPDNGGSSLP